ncbi:thiamine phosphate synthase [Longitalea luteola]|uniref:thiamine phosphate synthase n=1 Tax=Longitalea luteola TaxID=2812563 RepID=UPI001A96C127|nr:thiamine phosphate synthase [Longitalea luteola]
MFSLVVISKAELFTGEASIIQQLFEAGMERFHLRKPGADEQAVRQLLNAIPAEWHKHIALHSHHHLVQEYDIRRLHFTEQQRAATDEGILSEMKARRYLLSTSVHDLLSMQLLSTRFSYTFFSPVFDSISKQQYKGVAGDTFYLADKQKAVPVIALGGIDAGNIQSVAAMNFDGAAVLGTIWNEPAKAVSNYTSLLTQLKLTHTI